MAATTEVTTTVGGFLPLILFGDSFWRPLAMAVSGGILGATVLALVLVPALFVLISRRHARSRPQSLALLGDAAA